MKDSRWESNRQHTNPQIQDKEEYMKPVSSPPADVGVIVGRFQVHELHEAHKSLIQTVLNTHDHVIVFLGLSPLRNTLSNPLDFASRKRMFQESFPDVEVHYIDDNRSDEEWSKNLDREISKWTKPSQTVMLYGSRDSFINHYSGRFSTCELESTSFISGTEIRRRIANSFPPTREFRAGLIASTFNRYPIVYPTVDVAVIDYQQNRLLLARKSGEKQLRFIGGFASKESDSYELDARREVYEETGIEIADPVYIGSKQIVDWRYRGEVDTIKTLLFMAPYMFGRPEGRDDIESTEWVFLTDVLNCKVEFVSEHRPLAMMFREWLTKQINTGNFILAETTPIA